jgi:hypothetical protein
MLKYCSRSLKGEMPFVGLSMWLMIINQWMAKFFKSHEMSFVLQNTYVI